MNNLGLYIHVPFCQRKCYYCNFYSARADRETIDSYCDKVCQAIKSYPFSHKIADTIYFGGGTPSLAGAKNIDKLLNAVYSKFSVSSPEITLEANPTSLDKNELSSYKNMGITRLSFGVQSLDNDQLKKIGRAHSRSEVISCLEKAVSLGFPSVSADLMLGLPNENKNRLEDFVRTMDEIGVSHISSYMLKIEEGTALSKMEVRKQCCDEDEMADVYEFMVKLLSSYGYEQYEISNFARDKKFSLHNIKYWSLEDYIGIGPSAHSFIDGKRYAFNLTTKEFLAEKNPYDRLELVSEGGDFVDFLMLGLRLKWGVSIDEIMLRGEKENIDTKKILARADIMAKEGLAIKTDRLSLTTKGYLLSNSVISFLLWG